MRNGLQRGYLTLKRAGTAILMLAFAATTPALAKDAQPAQAASGTIYYVSSSAGNDAWGGTSPTRPWQTLDRASRARLAPGDRLLLKRGDRFVGQLQVRSSGAAGRPLVIASYGSGPKPLIVGSPAQGLGHTSAILIRNQQQIEISDLEIANPMAQAPAGTPQGWSFGIDIENDGGGVLEHFLLTRLTVHDVFAPPVRITSEDEFNSFAVSAIRFAAKSKPAKARPSFFRDIVIADNAISLSGRFGVQIGSASPDGNRNDAQARDPDTGFSRDMIVRDNQFFLLGGSAVQLAGVRNALIENNDFDRIGVSVVPGRMVGRGSGAWVVNSRDIVAQHNRSRHIRGYKDSYGMHVDFGNLNVLYQYNYSENSEGGFIEILGDNRNVIWRYNISVNDGFRKIDGNTLWFSTWSPDRTPSDEIYIYNNTVFVRPGLSPGIDLRARHAHVWNNIFHAEPGAEIGKETRLELAHDGLDLAGNLYDGAVSKAFRERDSHPRTGNPRFAEPGAAMADGYRLCPGSAAQDAGVAVRHPPFPAAGTGIFAQISEQPRTDYFGNALLAAAAAPDIGAAAASRKQEQAFAGCSQDKQ